VSSAFAGETVVLFLSCQRPLAGGQDPAQTKQAFSLTSCWGFSQNLSSLRSWYHRPGRWLVRSWQGMTEAPALGGLQLRCFLTLTESSSPLEQGSEAVTYSPAALADTGKSPRPFCSCTFPCPRPSARAQLDVRMKPATVTMQVNEFS